MSSRNSRASTSSSDGEPTPGTSKKSSKSKKSTTVEKIGKTAKKNCNSDTENPAENPVNLDYMEPVASGSKTMKTVKSDKKVVENDDNPILIESGNESDNNSTEDLKLQWNNTKNLESIDKMDQEMGINDKIKAFNKIDNDRLDSELKELISDHIEIIMNQLNEDEFNESNEKVIKLQINEGPIDDDDGDEEPKEPTGSMDKEENSRKIKPEKMDIDSVQESFIKTLDTVKESQNEITNNIENPVKIIKNEEADLLVDIETDSQDNEITKKSDSCNSIVSKSKQTDIATDADSTKQSDTDSSKEQSKDLDIEIIDVESPETENKTNIEDESLKPSKSNTEKNIKGIKNEGFKPDVMIEIPTEGLIDIVDLDEFEENENPKSVEQSDNMDTESPNLTDSMKDAQKPNLLESVTQKPNLSDNAEEVPNLPHNAEEVPNMSDNAEVQEITDSLGLLAESSRVMDDDDEPEDDDDDDSLYDQDDESNTMAAENSEDSNAVPSEGDVNECAKETAATNSTKERDDNSANKTGDLVINEDIDNTTDKVPTPEKDGDIKDKTTTDLGILKNLLTEKNTANKTARLEISTPNLVMNIVELDESSSDEDMDSNKTDSNDCDNITQGNEQTDIHTDKEPAVPKKIRKMTKLNTSEISIKTASKCKPPLVIPEISNNTEKSEESPIHSEVNRNNNAMGLEVFNLDSDEEHEPESNPQPVKCRMKCVNVMCNNKDELCPVDSSVAAYYGSNEKRCSVCNTCLDKAERRMENLIEGIKNMTPLLDLDIGKPPRELVEILDSDSDEEEDLTEENEEEPIGEKSARYLEDKLAEIINETWIKYNMENRLKQTKDIIYEQLDKMQEQCNEIDEILETCQEETDRVRTDFYKTFEPVRKALDSIIIRDTPEGAFITVDETSPTIGVKTRRSSVNTEIPSKKMNSSKEHDMELDHEIDIINTEDSKVDDDSEVSVVQLCVEAAPAGLPPAGRGRRPALAAGLSVFARRHAFGAWLKATVVEVQPKAPSQTYTLCRVKFENKSKGTSKVLPAKCLAYPEPSEVRLTIGTRVIAIFKDKRESFYSGVVAEVPSPVNNYRYLVFFDDGYAQYVRHGATRVVCESSARVWDEVHPYIRDFIAHYLRNYPERPMVRLHPGQKLKTEWNGKWWISKVLEVDASLAHVHFEEDNRTEWIYRGSTRLAPLYLELKAAENHRNRLPRSKAQNRSNMPYVEYTRQDEQTNKTASQNVEDIRRQRSVAKKSTSVVATPPPPAQPIDAVISRVVYYTPKHAVKPLKLVPHTCSPKCKRTDVLSLKDLRTYNPLAKPLLSGWERLLVRGRGQRIVMYRAPCGRRVRDVVELHHYLTTVQSDMPVDLFDFNINTHCLAEFVLNKISVMKKDLSNGKENVPVPCVNYYDDTLPEFCSYNTERTPTAGVPLNLDPDFLCGCDCEDDCVDKTKCSCWQMTLEGARTIGLKGPDVGYVYRRLPEPLPSGIYECNSRCKCKSTCLNRVAQQPLQLKLQVFKTLNRGWGIRALNDVPKGSFLCVYAGNLLTDATANLDGLNEGDEYLAELDYIEVVEQMKEGYEEDIPEEDKKMIKKETGKKPESESEGDESISEDDGDVTDNDKQDDDFQPGHIGLGLTEFNKRLRIRDKKIKDENDKNEKESKETPSASKQQEIEKVEIEIDFKKEIKKDTDEFITISDDEEVREPSRFTAQAEMGDKEYVSKYRSVRALYGKDEACYIMDAKVQGNIGRYLNHSCSPNVFVQNVFVDTHDPRFPWVAFFALSHIRAGTELTWNYNYDIGSVPGKILYCYCGTPNCRGRLL